MHAYLIVASDTGLAQEKTQEILTKHNLIRRDWELSKIADVRQLENFTKLSLNTPTAIVIANFENASIAAQNAFLKNLEEPQSKLKFIICSRTLGNILPTIHSRCELIELKTNKIFSNNLLDLAKEFLKNDYEGRYKIFTKINKREEALEFCEALLQQAREQMKKGELQSKYTANIQNCFQAIHRNGNVALQLTNLAA